MRVLIVEDDAGVAEPLVAGLRRNGFEACGVTTAADALRASDYDVVLLDLGLPDRDGTDLCRELRQRSSVPIIVISARSEEVDRVLALELGADDYLVKPFGFRELVARIGAVTRRVRTRSDEEDPIDVSGVRIDRRTHRVTKHGQPIHMTPKEYELLELLASSAGAVVTRDRILEEVWDTDWFGTSKMIDVHVGALRRKLGDPALIETVRGIGFRFASSG